MVWGAAILAFLVSFAVVRLLLSRFAGLALDRPNERSLHERPVPRSGGIAVLAGAVSGIVLAGAALWLPLALALALAVVSLVDDLRGLPRRLRLAVHLAAAAALCWYLLSPMHPVQLALLVLAVVWITNLYNFMDGSDGLAGGMAVIGFSAYALAAWQAGALPLAQGCAAIAAASLAFLIHNFHPARIFLGDVGSIPLGFLAAGIGILGWRNDLWPLWFPLLVFGPFNADATVTFVRRLARRQRVWQAHRDHYYQRIVRMGFGHRATALIGYALMLFCALAALLGRGQPPALQAGAFALGALGLGAMALWVDSRWLRFTQQA